MSIKPAHLSLDPHGSYYMAAAPRRASVGCIYSYAALHLHGAFKVATYFSFQSQNPRGRLTYTPTLRWWCRTAPRGSSDAPLNQAKWSAAAPRWPGVSSRISPTPSMAKHRMWWVLAGWLFLLQEGFPQLQDVFLWLFYQHWHMKKRPQLPSRLFRVYSQCNNMFSVQFKQSPLIRHTFIQRISF